MPILAIETCFGAVSVALCWHTSAGEQHCHTRYEERATGHAERLLPMIAEVMAIAGAPPFAQLQRIAVTTGPGTFTGVRTGVATARALALASGRPVCGTSSLAVMARRGREIIGDALRGRSVAVAVDARRGEIYLQCFDSAGGMAEIMSPAVLPIAEAARRLQAGPWLAVGSGARALAEAVAASGGDVEATQERLEPNALTLAQMAPLLPFLDPPMPFYLRAPDAKPQMSKILPRA